MRTAITRRQFTLALASLVATVACSAAAPARPTNAPTTSAPATVPSPAPSTKQPPSGTAPAGAAGPAGKLEDAPGFKELLDAARKEGVIVHHGVPSVAVRTGLPPAFKQAFGVELEFTGVDSTEDAQRIQRESAANNLSIDVISSGQTTIANVLFPQGLLQPVKPLLIHPDVKNPALWYKGEPWFMDSQGTILRIFNAVSLPMVVNLDYVKPQEIKASKDVMDPKWKGKISTNDPTVPGPGASNFALWMRFLGEDWLVKFVKEQEIVFFRDRRQQADDLAQGKHPITFSLGNAEVGPLRRDGFKVQELGVSDVPASLTPASGMFVTFKQSPHSKAAQLLLNWIISKEGMQLYTDLEQYPGMRTDLDTSKLNPANVAKPGVNYFDTASWEYTTTDGRKDFARLAELFRR